MRPNSLSPGRLAGATLLLCCLAGIKLLVHFASNTWFNYGFFRDEFYYIACGEHLAWGYVDHPPLAPALAAMSRALFGDSLFAIRLLPAAAGALTVFITGLAAREMGGGRFAQALAAVAAIAAPVFLGLDTFFSMNAFDLLFWTLGAYLLVLVANTNSPKIWYLLGAVMGVGLMNKISMLWFGFGLFCGLLLTRQRKLFLRKEPWIAALISFAIFLPHIIWQAANDFPTLEFMRNAARYKMATTSFAAKIKDLIIMMHPLALPVWLSGLYFCLLHRKGRQYNVLGILFLAVFLLLAFKPESKAYYFVPSFPILLASGAVLVERITQGRIIKWLRPVYLSVMVIGGIMTVPLALPVLPVEKYIEYSRALGLAPPQSERHEQGKLNQFFADMHGWEEMVATVAGVYNRLTPEEQAQCVIGCENYGEAGAVDFLGRKYGLPRVISPHNNYFLWGPGEKSGEIAIATGSLEGLKAIFEEVEVADTIYHEYSMPYENRPLYLCRKPRIPLKEVWPRLKIFI